MSQQQFMYNEQEPSPGEERNVNRDPREQVQKQEFSAPYGEVYGVSGQQQMGAKIHPQQQRRRGVNIKLLLVLLLIGCLALAGLGTTLGLTGGRFSSASATPVTQTFTVAAHPHVIINDDSGSIRIHTGNTGTVVVQSTKRVIGLGADLNGVQVTTNKVDENTLEVTGKSAPGSFVLGVKEVDFDITVPSESDIEVTTGSGSANVSDVQGQVSIKSGSGSIDANNINGQVRINCGSGTITAQNSKISGDSSFETGSGTVNFDGALDPKGNYTFRTGSGSLNVTLPSTSAFHLDASTGSGSVNNQFGTSDVGSDPRPNLTMRTGSGSINLNKGP